MYTAKADHPLPGVGRAMDKDFVLELVAELLKLALVLSLPLLAVILIVGLIVSVLQVVTQVQDPSIAFIPKLLLFGVVLALLAPWMLNRLTAFGVAMFARLAQ
jgi:flagellar biosynthetic protein FliQ